MDVILVNLFKKEHLYFPENRTRIDFLGTHLVNKYQYSRYKSLIKDDDNIQELPSTIDHINAFRLFYPDRDSQLEEKHWHNCYDRCLNWDADRIEGCIDPLRSKHGMSCKV